MTYVVKNIILFGFLSLLTVFVSPASAQFYVSDRVCVQDIQSSGTVGATTPAICESPTVFFDEDPDINTVQWDFGDGNASLGRYTTHAYLTPGSYTVSRTKILNDASTHTDTKTITAHTYPEQPMFGKDGQEKIILDSLVCDKNKVILDPFEYNPSVSSSSLEFRWFPGGETTRTIEIDKPGCYSVEVFDLTTRCSRTARINVKICLENAPSANEDQKWYFGDHAGISFVPDLQVEYADSTQETGSVFPQNEVTSVNYLPEPTSSNPMNTQGATAMAYSPEGKLVLYTDGQKVYSAADNQEIPNISGQIIKGNTQTFQGVALIAKPSCNECPFHQYQLLSFDPTSKVMYYHIIDMRLNVKKGAIVETNIPLLYDPNPNISFWYNKNTKQVNALVPSANNNDIHLITVDSLGTKLTSQTNTLPFSNPESGSTISPSGRYYAVGTLSDGQNHVLIYNLDAENVPTLFLNIDLNISTPSVVSGLAFSESESILYVSLKSTARSSDSYLLQLDLSSGSPATISSTANVIAQSSSDQFGAILLGPKDKEGIKKIYVSVEGKSYLPYIQNSNTVGDAAKIMYSDRPDSDNNRGIDLRGNASRLGFPNIFVSPSNNESEDLTATYNGNCFQTPTILTAQPVCSPLINDFTWIFEDGSTVQGSTASYIFPKIGVNRFKLKVKISKEIVNISGIKIKETCTEKELDARVYVKPSPQFAIPNPIYVCTQDAVGTPISPQPTGGNTFTYSWQTALNAPLSSDSVYIAFFEGPYYVTITNELNCGNRKDFVVEQGCQYSLIFPDSFSPNSDNINESFTYFYRYVENFNLKVFDRWGEIIYTSENIDEFWDGRFNGKPVATGIYPYIATFRSKYEPEKGLIKQHGSVVVLK